LGYTGRAIKTVWTGGRKTIKDLPEALERTKDWLFQSGKKNMKVAAAMPGGADEAAKKILA